MLLECPINNRETKNKKEKKKEILADVDLHLLPSHMQSKEN